MGDRGRGGRAGPGTRSRKPLGGVRGGTSAYGSRGPRGLPRDAALTPPRGCRSAELTFPAGAGPGRAGPRGTRFSGPAEPVGAVGPREVARGPREGRG